MSEQMIALFITIAVVTTLVLWVPVICLLVRSARTARNRSQAAKYQVMFYPDNTDAVRRKTR